MKYIADEIINIVEFILWLGALHEQFYLILISNYEESNKKTLIPPGVLVIFVACGVKRADYS